MWSLNVCIEKTTCWRPLLTTKLERPATETFITPCILLLWGLSNTPHSSPTDLQVQPDKRLPLSSWASGFHYDGSRLTNPREFGRFLLALPDAYARTPKISPTMEASRVVPTSDSMWRRKMALSSRRTVYDMGPVFVRWCRVPTQLALSSWYRRAYTKSPILKIRTFACRSCVVFCLVCMVMTFLPISVLMRYDAKTCLQLSLHQQFRRDNARLWMLRDPVVEDEVW